MSIKMKFEFLPNEILIKCFQYLDTPDIFYSFDQLNYRFYTLIRDIPLHLNFEELKKSKFKQFCQIILSNSKLKHNVMSLKLSNKGTRSQIEEFLSLFPLNELINLRSLSLVYLTDNNIEQLSSMLPFLSNLDYFSFIDFKSRTSKILPMLSNSKLRILSIPNFDDRCVSFFQKFEITSLTISHCELNDLCELFEHISMLKYLKIENLGGSIYMNDPSKLSNGKIVYLKQLIMNYCMCDFEIVEQLLKRIPNLTMFTIRAAEDLDIIDANRWQHLIESSLPHLRVFNFKFSFIPTACDNDTLNILQQFQTNFWCKQHHWYTNYEISFDSASIYTIPYIWNDYSLRPTMNIYSDSNRFDNVKKLILSRMTITNNSSYYFKNVQSLTFINEYDTDSMQDSDKLQIPQIKFLSRIIDSSNVTHLALTNACNMDLSSSLFELLKELPYASSLQSDRYTLKSFYTNQELCEYLNRKINTLHISGHFTGLYIKSDEVDLLCRTFSNVEQLHCYIEKLDDLLLILKQCSKLSIINLSNINKHIYSWIQMNASKLNVYIDFRSIDGREEDFFIRANAD